MERIGIYGDSWADPNHGHDHNPGLANLAWCKRIKNANIYARGGSSIYYSYQLFMQTHEQHDKVIFVATNPGRWHLPITVQGREFHLNAPGTVKWFLERGHELSNLTMTPALDSKLRALEQFYLELSDFNTDQEICSLMLDRVMATRPDTVLVMSHNTGWYNNWSLLSKYYMPMCESFGNLYKTKVERNHGIMPYSEKNMVCHMTAETNEIVYNHMLHRLQHGTWPEEAFSVQHIHLPEYYWNIT